MKGKILTILLIVVTLVFGYTTVYAACHDSLTTFQDPSGNNTDITWEPSQNVTLCANVVAQSYAAQAKHLNGNRTYGAASNSTRLYWQSSSTGTAISSDPSASDSSAFSGWNTL